MESTPFTERSNGITENIDRSSPLEMIQLLSGTDMEIFTGVNAENLYNERVVKASCDVTELVRKILQDSATEDVAIVLAGCGTSGRLAFLISRICNNLTEKIIGGKPFYYSIAGGNKSILTSQEAPEDDPNEGVASLVKICKNKRKVIYIGITCGISAPFVGRQLDYCMTHLDVFTPVLLGFNPTSMARDVAIPYWDKTMRVMATEMDALSNRGEAYIINPVLGAEAITGSSRMKGGSATKIILETIFLTALNALGTERPRYVEAPEISQISKLYEDVCRKFYESSACNVMANLVQRCGDALKAGGTVRYLASGWTGVLPLIDATECPPTFGSSVNDIRGFVFGGYDFLKIEDFGKENDYFKLGFDDFTAMYEQSRTSNDAVFAFIQSPNDPIMESLSNSGLGATLRNLKGRDKTVLVVLEKPNEPIHRATNFGKYFDQVFRAPLPEFDGNVCANWNETCRKALEDSLYGCCLKWMVNAASTGGHVLLGKVYKNFMHDVKVSNNKLFHRAIEIIKKICPDVDHDRAADSLLKSIYEFDELTYEIRNDSVSNHYKLASSKDQVVPVAIILAELNCSVDIAKRILQNSGGTRSAILEVVGK